MKRELEDIMKDAPGYMGKRDTTKERTWDCYTLSESDIRAVAERSGLSLEDIDFEDVIASIKTGIEWALDNRDEIIRDAIWNATKIAQDRSNNAKRT